MPKRLLKIIGPSNIWEAGEYAQAWHKRRHLTLLSLLSAGDAIKNMRGLADGILLLSVPHLESHSSKYALAGYHRTTGIGEETLKKILRPLFVPVAFQRYPP